MLHDQMPFSFREKVHVLIVLHRSCIVTLVDLALPSWKLTLANDGRNPSPKPGYIFCRVSCGNIPFLA